MKKKIIFEYTQILLMALLLAINYIFFIVPNNFAPAGINGIATMVQYKCGLSIGYFSLIINVPLCIFGYFYVDKDFAIKTLVFCLVYSGIYLLLQQFDFSNYQYNAHGVDTIFPCLIAGMISGLIYGILFKVNSCSGGTDIVSKWINKKHQAFNFFWVIFSINAVVAFVSLFVYGSSNDTMILDYRPVCLCILYCFMSSFIGNKILHGNKTAYKFIIISPHTKEIENDIIHRLRHSATRFNGKGIYTNEDKEVLMCLVNKHQLIDFKNILKEYSDTFTFIEVVEETVGNFKRIK